MGLLRRFFHKGNSAKPDNSTCRASDSVATELMVLQQHGLKVSSKIGEGTFGKVYMALSADNQSVVAVKVVERNPWDSDSQKMVQTEIHVLKSLRHPGVVRLHDTWSTVSGTYMVMEYAMNGDLTTYLRRHPNSTDATKKSIFRQVSLGVAYCHEHNIAHRDLKLENILIDEDMGAKLADFGLATVHKSERALCRSFCGTMAYMAPEVAACIAYNPMVADIWSLGVVQYVLMYEKFPFVATSTQVLLKAQLSGKLLIKLGRDSRQSLSCRQLMEGMLQPDVHQRLTAVDVVNASWFNAVI